MTNSQEITKKCGYVAIIGRPNVGKSTLLNQILGEKVSITSDKPQTTRHQILGIKTKEDTQTLYLDTPGLHKAQKNVLQRVMNRAAMHAVEEANVIGFVIDGHWTSEDEKIKNNLTNSKVPVVLIINKIDRFKEQDQVLPYLEILNTKMNFAAMVPISARKDVNIAHLEEVFASFLPTKEFDFPPDQYTDRSERFLVSELIREKLMRGLYQEVPYGVSVTIESFQEMDKVVHINAIIWVDREGQKPIIIGEKGSNLKKIGFQARQDMEKLLSKKVYLTLWVKIKSDWNDSEKILKDFGY